MSLRVLLVDANAANLSALKAAIAPLADVDAVSDFPSARELLRSTHYDRLVANFRLGAYNGLHLAYVADPDTRSIIYTEQPEGWCSREVERAGAIYEHRDGLHDGIAAYIEETLPLSEHVHLEESPGNLGGSEGVPVSATPASLPDSRWLF